LVIGGIKTEENKEMMMTFIKKENFVSPSPGTPRLSVARGEEVNGTPELGGK
jgi:hypothetical protein